MEVRENGYFCPVCKTSRASDIERGVKRSGLSSVVFVGGFMLLLLATTLFTAFPQLEVPLTWTSLYSLYLVYFGLAFANFRRKLYA